ncbi:unnamed protein product [Staurois parvus]|uniref:Gamma-tubulin complex component n=1 Tax=Staurois parvus TaxID=386267 RepID=A0ABN9GJX2_9NEOB|nr:unnamed protein product [Staurois parvus]
MGGNRGNNFSFPTGVKLLSYLYKESLENSSNENYPILLSLLKSSCEPYTRFIYDWVYSGVLRDIFKEFMIQVNEDFLGFRDQRYWIHGYILISKEVEDCVPVFLKHLANEIYMCGKTINLLKLCCPKHYICWSDIPVPRISVTFSLEELKEMKKDCAIYVARMERIARYSSISKEEKELQAEFAKQDLIIQARETAEKLLERFKDRQLAEKISLDTKKRELFLKLKEQFEKDQERRLATRQEEADDDFSYARELRDREQRLKALEEELENKAREELIEHYSRLSEEATRKEQKALWKLQRHKLETARLKFFWDDEKHIQELLKQNPVAQSTENINTLPLPEISPTEPTSLSDNVNEEETREENLIIARAPSPLLENKLSPLIVAEKEDTDCCHPSLCTPGVDFSDFLPVTAAEKQDTELTSDLSQVDDALKGIGSDLAKSKEKQIVTPVSDYDFNTVLKPVPFTQVSQGHIQIGEYISNEQPRRPRWNFHGHASDANIKVGEYVPDTPVTIPQPSQHGHSSDSHINIGDFMSDVQPSRPHWNLYGHVSEGHIKIGEYASDVEPSRPRQNIYGHSSEANIKVGENVSDVKPSRPRWNVHGHASDANIKIGENVSEVVSSRPRWNIHGHASQSHIQIGSLVSDVEPIKPRWSPFGHATQSSIKIGEWSSSVDDTVTPVPKTEFAHPSDSTIQNVIYGERKDFERPPETPETEDFSSEQTCSSDPVTVVSPSSMKEEESEEGLQAAPENMTEDSRPASTGSPVNIKSEDPTCSYEESGNTTHSEDVQVPEAKEVNNVEDETWQKEQDYIQSLADKYCLEKYQDSYAMMSEPPVLQMLNHVITGEFSLPMDPNVHSATDETAVMLIELLSLPVLMKYSVTAPIVSHVSLVNKAVVDFYFVELNMEKHFVAIRHFLLMEDGEFAQSLSDQLFEKLVSGQTPGELFTPLVLNSILNKALQYSLHGDSQLASNLSFALKYIPEMFTPAAPDILSCLELRYKVRLSTEFH